MTDTTVNRLSRSALVLAAMLAVVAIGGRAWRDRAVAPEAAANATAAQPDVATVISKLEAKVKANPKDPEGWRMLGWSFFQTQRFGEAAMAYERAAKLDPNKPDYWSSLGESLVMAGPGTVPPDAKAAFDRAVALDPKDPRARYFLGVAQDMAGDHRGAIDAWFALLKDTPAGAPWEADVRRTIEQVGKKDGIDVGPRLAALRPLGTVTTGPTPGTAGAAIPGPTPEQMRAASSIPPGAQQQMIAGMVEGLAAKLKANPKNVEGWIMLMRSRVQLGQQREARTALASAKSANPGAAGQLDDAAKELGL